MTHNGEWSALLEWGKIGSLVRRWMFVMKEESQCLVTASIHFSVIVGAGNAYLGAFLGPER